jgi:hypothetical protein
VHWNLRDDGVRGEPHEQGCDGRILGIASLRDEHPAGLRHESTYRLTGDYQRFFEDVLDYCAEVTESAGADERRRRLAFWGTLALMRCVGSSPAAALRALRTRADLDADAAEDEALRARVLDGEAEDLEDDDAEPPAAIDDPRLAGLIDQARRLAEDPKRDPKLKVMLDAVGKLVSEGFNPVVFCRYIATAQAVGEQLRKALKDVTVDVVTGELPSEERRARVAQLGEEERRLLVATDCLSEGINLQDGFDAVFHYDLSWNPTRHQQREGRVDRFGQPSAIVRSLLLYGENNPVDGAVLNVILRKAETIRRETGVPVPLPDDERRMTEALMQAVLLRRSSQRQMMLDLAAEPAARAIDEKWRDAAEREKRNRTVFAQRQLKPEEVEPEWEKARSLLGGPLETRRFVERALARLRAPLEPMTRGFRTSLSALVPVALRERLAEEGIENTIRVHFGDAPGSRRLHLHRAHPLVGLTAETLVQTALDPASDPADPSTLPRAGVWRTRSVSEVTTVVVLRIRHQVETTRAGATHAMLAEEACLAAFGANDRRLRDADAAALLEPPPHGDLALHARQRRLADALARLPEWKAEFDTIAGERAEALSLDHARLRQAAKLQEQEFFAARAPAIAEAANKAARERLIRALADAEEGSTERKLHAEFEFAKSAAEAGSLFVRGSGRYALTGTGDVNTYALFAELFADAARQRAGVIVPTGIATDATTAPFFASLSSNRRLVRLVDFENREGLFPAVDSRMKFAIMTLGRNVPAAEFAFFLTNTAQWAETERRFALSAEDIARLNPNTRTAAVFRSKADAQLATKIYHRVPILADDSLGEEGDHGFSGS